MNSVNPTVELDFVNSSKSGVKKILMELPAYVIRRVRVQSAAMVIDTGPAVEADAAADDGLCLALHLGKPAFFYPAV